MKTKTYLRLQIFSNGHEIYGIKYEEDSVKKFNPELSRTFGDNNYSSITLKRGGDHETTTTTVIDGYNLTVIKTVVETNEDL